MLRELSPSPLERTAGLTDPCVVAADRAYLIGTQDGGFPDMGFHTEGEMGGFWVHPMKLLDGFWLQIGNVWFQDAHHFVSGPFWNEQTFDLPDGGQVVRRLWVPDGQPVVVIRYSVSMPGTRELDLRFLARTDIRPVWPSKDARTDGHRDEGHFDPDLRAWHCYDPAGISHVLIGASGLQPAKWTNGDDLWGPERTAGYGTSVALDYVVTVPQGDPIDVEFVLAGGNGASDAIVHSFQHVCAHADDLYQAKQSRYTNVLSRSTIHIPDTGLQRTWDWVKCTYDWLIRDVPGVGRGLGAGLPDYPWWFGCDNTYALLGCLALGQHETAIETLDLIRHLSVTANGTTGRVIHEANTRGTVVHPGCAEETPHFVSAVWQTFCWTGDLSFLERNYDFCRRGLLDWTLRTQCRDGDVLPYGYGLVEILGFNLQCIDTAVFTAEALSALLGMATALGDADVVERCCLLHVQVTERIRHAFWMETEGLFGDMIATPAELIPPLQKWVDYMHMPQSPYSLALGGLCDILDEAKSEPEQNRKRPWLLMNWIVALPFAAGLASSDQARRGLDRLESAEFSGPWGMYANGMDRTKSMSINTGALAVAECVYGRVDQGLAYISRLTDTLDMHMPGALSEISPDQGCFVQAWSGYAVTWPVVRHIFGIQPDSFRRAITVNPCFPDTWPEARLDNVHIGEAAFDFLWNSGAMTVTCHTPGWSVTSTTASIRVETA